MKTNLPAAFSKKALPAAIALVGSLGLAGTANAINVNPDGTGEILLYSLYTTEGGNDSLINITNTTEEAVAVKVRFIEGMNSQEVLDFNLYLSHEDVWTGAIVRSAQGAMLITNDKSCTVPAIPAGGVEFRKTQYQGGSYARGKGGPQGTDRTRVGYVEVIEMGVLHNEDTPATPASKGFNPAYWATHTAGTPNSCAKLVSAWSPGSGAWSNDNDRQVSTPEGGLYGSMVLVNVDGGTDVAYDAVAIDNYAENDLHSSPGSLSPSLNTSGGNTSFDLPFGFSGSASRTVDAVSAVLMRSAIMNDYLTVSGLNAETDWVVTFPTKKFYSATYADSVNNITTLPPADGLPDAGFDPQPFVSFWNAGLGGSACEPFKLGFWDQEEGTAAQGGVDFSPLPPGAGPISLCWEANIVDINGSDTLGGGFTVNNVGLPNGFDAGWLRMDFTGSYPNNAVGQTFNRVLDRASGNIQGLPVIGFAVTAFVNGSVGGLLSNYAGLTEHKAEFRSGGVLPM